MDQGPPGKPGWTSELVEITLTHSDDARAVLELKGEIDMSNVPLLDKAIAELEKGELASIEIDLAGVSFIDSSGIRAFLKIGERSPDRTPKVTFGAPSKAVSRVLDIAGVADRLPWTSERRVAG